MKVYVSIILLCWLACGSPASQKADERDAQAVAAHPASSSDTLRVLFIGSSYT